MVNIKNMDSHQLAELVQAYPWFAPARARLCLLIAENSGAEAAEGLLRESLPFLPDGAAIARRIRSLTPRSFADKSMPASIQTDAPEPSRPKIYMAGMDFFSKEDYEGVQMEDDRDLGRMAIVDYSAAPAEMPAACKDEQVDLVSETLAQIFMDQGYPEQAKEIYTKLSLQSPEKNAYFASLIENLK